MPVLSASLVSSCGGEYGWVPARWDFFNRGLYAGEIERGGVRFALIALFDDVELRHPQEELARGVMALASDEERLQAAVVKARDGGADYLVLLPHWGREHQVNPSRHQIESARRWLEMGGDVVVGGGSHYPQKVDRMVGRPVLWSLGNLVFDGTAPDPGWSRGQLLSLEFGKTGDGEKVQPRRVQVLPFSIAEDGRPQELVP